jgi:hypothetical protein
MQALIERCCGLDVHQETVVACLLIGAAGARVRKEVRTFPRYGGNSKRCATGSRRRG